MKPAGPDRRSTSEAIVAAEGEAPARLSTPGIERLYSGVVNSTPSASRMVALKRSTGSDGSASTS